VAVNILRGKVRNVTNNQTPSQLILQGNIHRLAQDERVARELVSVRERQAWLNRMMVLDAIVGDPAAMESFIAHCSKIVDGLLVDAACPDLSSVLTIEKITEGR